MLAPTTPDLAWRFQLDAGALRYTSPRVAGSVTAPGRIRKCQCHCTLQVTTLSANAWFHPGLVARAIIRRPRGQLAWGTEWLYHPRSPSNRGVAVRASAGGLTRPVLATALGWYPRFGVGRLHRGCPSLKSPRNRGCVPIKASFFSCPHRLPVQLGATRSWGQRALKPRRREPLGLTLSLCSAICACHGLRRSRCRNSCGDAGRAR